MKSEGRGCKRREGAGGERGGGERVGIDGGEGRRDRGEGERDWERGERKGEKGKKRWRGGRGGEGGRV